MFSWRSLLGITLAFFSADLKHAAAAEPSSRTSHRIGAYLSFGAAEPEGAITGSSIGLNLFDFLRITGSYGAGDTSYAGAAIRIMIPTFNLTPYAGLTYGLGVGPGVSHGLNEY